MSYYEDENPVPISNEALLRFLDSNPSARPLVLDSSRDSTQNEENPNEASPANELHPKDRLPNCPSPEGYLTLALGEAEKLHAEYLLAHAAACDACGNRLATSLAVLEGNPSLEEAAAISKVGASGEWTQEMARRLAATRPSKRTSFRHPFLRPKLNSVGGWAYAGVAALLIAGAALAVWQRQTNTPDHQLAMAYSQARTFELRIPEAGYAALTPGNHTRGSLAGHEPAALLEARARLTRSLESSPEDAHLLELRARADLLEERYDAAVSALDSLLIAQPATAELLCDAAAAYYQRGLVLGNEIDRSTALDYLRRADALAPTDPVVLFNEAIVMEDRGQMMSAVEVWNRYITVERDANWAAEGKRKLAALELTLNRLKSHQSRIEQMLASPEAMNALASDGHKLASLDEELSSIQLDKLLLMAFPLATDGAAGTGPNKTASSGAGQARGSPCDTSCQATRQLLKALSKSLELNHHDFWLSELLSPQIDSLPTQRAVTYTRAIRLLAQATREDQTGVPTEGARLAEEAQSLFQQLHSGQEPLGPAARAGKARAAVEYLFALQRESDFAGCRSFAEKRRAQAHAVFEENRYPWIRAVAMLTEKVCDDSSETRRTGRALELNALHLAQTVNYPLLMARIHLMQAMSAQDAGDEETAEKMTMAILRELYSADTPPIRIVNTTVSLSVMEQNSPRAHSSEIYKRESLDWLELVGSHAHAAVDRMYLAQAEIRIGAIKEAENQLRLANLEEESASLGKAKNTILTESWIFLADLMLERDNLLAAEHYLDQAAENLDHYSDTWGLRTYAAARGQLQLAQGHLDQAAAILESSIRDSEGMDARRIDRSDAAEYGQQDHDLYAELAATWLAQGRSSESVLALWERFRLRSRGLRITRCAGGALDCDEPRLIVARRELNGGILLGQIVLADRILVYRADRGGVEWTQKPLHRDDVIDAVQTLQHAVNSASTSEETALRLGSKLSADLLPRLPSDLDANASLELEQDPMLQDLPWPVLPASAGPLGLQYSLAEVRSILADPESRRGGRSQTELRSGGAPQTENGSNALIVGASVASEGEPPLPEALDEARNVGRFLHTSDLLLGERATTSHVAASLGSARIFHFAGHALQTTSGTELLLAANAPDERTPWIDGAFLRKHPPRECRLAVLSACATGIRASSGNNSLQDLVETLGSLGVPEVVATRWQIDSEASVPFMNAFYSNLAQGKSVAAALTAARRAESSQPKYNHPYYWGAFYVTGKGSVTQRKEQHASL
jgi:CHAT domain-containing protein